MESIKHSGDPFVRKYFSVKKHGTKASALEAAMVERDRLLNTRAFTQYFRHRVNGRRVKRPHLYTDDGFGIGAITVTAGMSGDYDVSHSLHGEPTKEVIHSGEDEETGAFSALEWVRALTLKLGDSR